MKSKTFHQMSTRSQERRNNQQENFENVSENLAAPVLVRNEVINDQDVIVAGPSRGKSPRIENSVLKL